MFSISSAKNLTCLTFAAFVLISCGTKNNNFFGDYSAKEAQLATVAYSQGNFNEAETHVINSLADNPRQAQAVLVGALVYEQLGRPNRARQYYEDLIIIGGDQTTVLGTTDGVPEKMSDIAKKRLRLINVRQSKLVIEDQDGNKVFNISDQAAKTQSRSAIEEALFLREKRNIQNKQPSTKEELQAVEVLFNDQEQNIISRFLILKELAEKDLITKEEFLNARVTNIGGLLPLTNTPPAAGIEKSVPSPDLVIERINVLKEAVESRTITPREYAAERNIIIEALLPPHPRQRSKPTAPARDILGAAKELRKLEILSDLNLITKSEKEKEKAAVEKYLGLNRAEDKPVATISQLEKDIAAVAEAQSIAPNPASKAPTITPPSEAVVENVTIVEELPAPAPKLLVPAVSDPF